MKINRVLAAITLSLFAAATVSAGTLSDISNSKYRIAIQELFNTGVISGYSDGTYRPLNPINRAEFTKMLMASIYGDVKANGYCFSDVKNEWFAPFVCHAKTMAVIKGYPDGQFKPSQYINYAEVLKIVYNSYNDPVAKQPDGQTWYSKYLSDAQKNGIALEGANPSHNMTRGDVAQFIWNYQKKKSVVLTPPESSPTLDPAPAPAPTPAPTPTPSPTSTVNPPQASVPPISAGGEIYVATTGNDTTGTGAIDKPYRTITKAVAAANPGNKVVLRNGTYQEGEIRVREPDITIMSKDGEWGVIKKALPQGADDYDSAVYFDVDAHRGRLSRVEVIGGFYAVSTETKWDWGIPGDRKGSSDIIIENSKIHGSGRDAIKIKPNSDNIKILNNEIYDTGKSQTPGDCNAEGVDNVNGDNMVVSGNYIHDTCSNGVYAKGGATNALIENNIFENIGEMGIGIGFDTSPEFFDLTVNPNYYESISATVRNNYIRNTGWAGIGLYASKDAVVTNNTLHNVATKDQAAIYFGVTLQDYEPAAKRPANVNPTIRNNIISQASSISRPEMGIRYANELGGLSALQGNATMSGNCYFHSGTAFSFFDGRPSVNIDSGTLAQWKSDIKSDSDAIEADPQLGSDRMPASSSACAGKGYKK